jgi:molecular chaperone HscC
LEVRASSGDSRLGGEDFRWRLAQRFLESNHLQWDELDGQERATVMRLAEEAKVELSLNQTALVECHLHGQDIVWPISREEFEALCHDLLERLRRPVERALSDAKLSPERIDEILLVGGATRMPMIIAIAAKLFDKTPRAELDPDRVVGIGAGIQAMLMTCDEAFDDVVMTDVCPWSLGIELVSNREDIDTNAHGNFTPIIERNTTVPVSRSMVVIPAQPKQKKINLRIFQGESRRVEYNTLLGSIEIKLKPNADVYTNQFDVRFTYDVNGLLEVEATHLTEGRTWRLVIEQIPGTMTSEQIETSLKKLAPLKMHPRDRQEYRHLLAIAERLFEDHLGEEREMISNMMSAFERVLDSQDLKACKNAAQEFRQELLIRWNLEA